HWLSVERPQAIGPDQTFWWNTSGHTLHPMLFHARYPVWDRYSSLRFFAESIVPYLGPARLSGEGVARWQSFMTDDGIPVELSWDWGSGKQQPKIRLSVEPVGPSAGIEVDPLNQWAVAQFHHYTIMRNPRSDFAWYTHFSDIFRGKDATIALTKTEGHLSQIFYAFDLDRSSTMAKAYFFPKWLAYHCNAPAWNVISAAIKTAPSCNSENLQVLSVLDGFFNESYGRRLEFEMLSTDLLRPATARLKIYFRSRDVSISSVEHIMSIRGVILSHSLKKGIRNIRRLCSLLVSSNGILEEFLDSTAHRTSGLLYYASFRLGDAIPSIKLYIPVRHFVSDDESVRKAVEEFLVEQGKAQRVQQYVLLTVLYSLYLVFVSTYPIEILL
ncbi:aromatic prenyltransferase, partial [Lindgomyces ingoldianus]